MRKWLPILAIVGFFALMVWLGYALIAGPHAPDVETAEISEIQKFISSDEFKDMSIEARADYTRRCRERTREMPREERRAMFRSDALSDAERRQMFQNMGEVRQQQMLEEAKRYFALSESEREAYLDERVKEMAERRGGPRVEGRRPPDRLGEASQRRRGEGGERRGGPWGRRNRNPDEMVRRGQRRLSEHNPEERAYIEEYFRVLREARRRARQQRT